MAAGLSYEKSSRATNMTYTSMLYALLFDRFVFGQTPGLWSIIGSTLILGSAIYMAMQRDSSSKEVNEGSSRNAADRDGADDEAGVGLMEAMENGDARQDNQDVEMRDFRREG